MGLFNIGDRMDQQPANLEQALAAARAAGVNRPAFKRQPIWQELEMDGHLKRLGWGLLVYLLALAPSGQASSMEHMKRRRYG